MKRFVVLPHADFTLIWEVPGWETVDLARAFVARLEDPEALQGAAASALAEGEDGARRALLLLAAAAVLARPAPPRSRLRAIGAALAASCGQDSAVRLRLDDLELARGTTERSQDVLAASRGPLPFEPELARGLALCKSATAVRLWIEKDQQLPAAFALAERLPRQVPLEVGGPFASVHREALGGLSPLRRARWVSDPAVARVAGTPGRPLDTTPRWGQAGEGPWCGEIGLEALVHPERLVESGCQGALLRFIELGPEGIRDETGEALSAEALRRGAAALGEAGVPLIGEWWVGAPGQTEAAIERTAAELEERLPFAGLAGVRPFHWARERPTEGWETRGIRFLSLPPDRDLQRSRPMEQGAGDVSGPARLEALATRLMRRLPLAPGRLAQALFASAPAVALQPPGALRLDPDCAVVELPVTLGGGAVPAHYALNLRTGATLQLDARLGPPLRAIGDGAGVDFLNRWPEGRRAKLVDALISKGVLAR